MRRYLIALAIALPVLFGLLFAVAYASDELVGDKRVAMGVSAAGIDLSRLTEESAAKAVALYEAKLASLPVTVTVQGTEMTITAEEAGLSVDEAAVAAAAMERHRSADLFANVSLLFSSFSSAATVAVPVEVNEDAITTIVDSWTEAVIDVPAYEGAVRLSNGKAVPEYPRPGLRIDLDATVPLIADQFMRGTRLPLEAVLVALDPQITDADVDAAVAAAAQLIGERVVLKGDNLPGTIVFTQSGLAAALQSEIVHHSPASIEVRLDPEKLREIASRSVSGFVVPPVDATFTLDTETRQLVVVPSIRGLQADLELIPQVVIAAAKGSGRGIVPMTDGEEAAFTTTDAEAMGPLGEVSTFTTTHPCCKNRVTNIQLLADEIKGAIVMPGAEFSINDRAGKRTTEEGYVRAGAIIGGRVQCCSSSINIGGGTSQFATTFYNAVFFGCYEDVFHQPHSLYFSRYPFVREATLGFPKPDVKFRNDSESVVYIETEHTPTSITVTLYGNNGGRTCTSERHGNTITRVMAHADGTITTQDWTWRYKKPKPDPVPPTTTTTPPVTTTTTTTTTTTP